MLKDITLGQYFPGDTIVHRLDPRTKILCVIVALAGMFFVSGAADIISRVASIPSLTGMERSMMTTSGFSRRVSLTACSPSSASPAMVKPGVFSNRVTSPMRRITWSSAISKRVLSCDRFIVAKQSWLSFRCRAWT